MVTSGRGPTPRVLLIQVLPSLGVARPLSAWDIDAPNPRFFTRSMPSLTMNSAVSPPWYFEPDRSPGNGRLPSIDRALHMRRGSV